jgi:hypothetical protein
MHAQAKRGNKAKRDDKMSKIIAVCGLVCDDCIAFIATQKDDDQLRERVVEAWPTEQEHLELKDINCDGCLAEGRLYPFCSACEARKCALEKGVENCAHCGSAPCAKLEELWKSFRTVSAAEAQANLERIRKGSRG